jgi:hypothetical protein
LLYQAQDRFWFRSLPAANHLGVPQQRYPIGINRAQHILQLWPDQQIGQSGTAVQRTDHPLAALLETGHCPSGLIILG